MTPFLADEEVAALITNACAREGGVGEPEMARIIDWANRARIDEMLLKLTLEGLLRVTFPEGFTEPVFLEKN